MRFLLTVLVLTVAASACLAQGINTGTVTDGALAAQLTQNMYCGIKSLVSGNLGLLVGFGVAVYGLMQLIQGSTAAGIMFIIGGALVTSLPRMIEGTVGGIGSILSSSNISADGTTYRPTTCGSSPNGFGGTTGGDGNANTQDLTNTNIGNYGTLNNGDFNTPQNIDK